MSKEQLQEQEEGQSQEEAAKQAQKLIQKEQQEKQTKFIEEYKALCTKHKMELIAVPQLSIKELK